MSNKVFISYHLADQRYVSKIKRKLEKHGIDYYAVDESADFTGWSNQRISEFILSKMSSCNVLLCIIGLKTYSRPHVDYELHHSLKGGVGKRLGWIIDLLETRQERMSDLDYSTVPNRIKDNESYGLFTTNSSLFDKIDELLLDANNRRNDQEYIVNNTRPCMELPKSKYYSIKI